MVFPPFARPSSWAGAINESLMRYQSSDGSIAIPFQCICHGVLEAHIFDHTTRVGIGLKIGNTDVLHGQTAVASTLAEEAHADGVEFRNMRIIIEAWPISQ